MDKVSVLVAVYNAADYLAQCLDSLLGQTFSNLQIICIDDASTDGSPAILRRYAAKDGRIEVLRLGENCGQAFARNEGLRVADGDLVCMLDADDWFSPDAIELAVKAFCQPEVDAVLFDVMMEYADHAIPYPMPAHDRTISGEEAFRLSLTWQIHGLYMVRMAIHQRYPFDTSCRLYSDDNTTRLHYFAARRVAFCPGVYHYRQHDASATHQVSVRRFDYLRANESMKAQLRQLVVSPAVLSLYEGHCWLNLIDLYMFYYVHGSALSPTDRAYGLSELHRVWSSVDRSLLSPSVCRKFGYRPMSTWALFRLQEWLYFTLRGLCGKNN
jgi:glycosyltransferase involved in cell wall biosynthesis